MYKIAIAAGGTGGHITPALCVAKLWRQRGGECIWFGRPNSLEANIVHREKIPFYPLSSTLNRKSGVLHIPYKGYNFLHSILQARKIMKYLDVKAVFSTGGYVSLAPALAIKTMEGKLMIHEQNMHMGMANNLLSKFASEIILGLPLTGHSLDQVLGNPSMMLSNRISHANKPFTLLVMGGSQGCHFFNKYIPSVLASLEKKDIKVIHLAGSEVEAVKSRYHKEGLEAEVHIFHRQMGELYQQADMVISRAGAMALSELSLYGLPAILVPYPHAAANHQWLNARYYEKQGAAVVIEESIPALEKAMNTMLDQVDVRKKMVQAMYALAKPNAAEDIVEKLSVMINANKEKLSD